MPRHRGFYHSADRPSRPFSPADFHPKFMLNKDLDCTSYQSFKRRRTHRRYTMCAVERKMSDLSRSLPPYPVVNVIGEPSMPDISISNSGAADRLHHPIASPAGRAPARPGEDRAGSRPSDRLEISDRARYLAKINRLPEIRADLVEQVKRDIAAGTYDDQAKIDAAADRLADDLDLFA